MGHLEAAVRILAMLARGGCSRFEERLHFLLQVGLVWVMSKSLLSAQTNIDSPTPGAYRLPTLKDWGCTGSGHTKTDMMLFWLVFSIERRG